MAKRIAFKMYLNEGKKSEYIKRHDELWPELNVLLKTSGVSEYYIFIDDKTNELIGTLQFADHIKFEALPDQPIMKKWWEYMKDIMKTNPDNSPVSTPLEQVFYLS